MADVPSFLRKDGDGEEKPPPEQQAAQPPAEAGQDAPQDSGAGGDDFLARLKASMDDGGSPAGPAPAAPLKAEPIAAEPIDDSGAIAGIPTFEEGESGGSAVAEAVFEKAVAAHDAEDLDAALDLYLQVVAADPGHVVARNNLGMIYIDRGDLDNAQAALVETLKVDPNYGEAYNNLGYIFRHRGMDPQAAWCYMKFLEIEPEADDAERIRGWSEAVKQQHGPPPAPPGLEALDQGSPPAIVEEPAATASPFEAAEEAMPKIQRTSGWEVSMPGGEEEAAAAPSAPSGEPVQKIEKVGGWDVPVAPEITQTEDTADGSCERGMALFDQGDVAGAERELRKAVSLDPSFAPAHSELGKVLIKSGRIDEGLFELREAVKRQPDDAGSHYVMGFALRSEGRDAEAAESYDRFLELMPDAEEADSIRAWIAEVRGEEPPAPVEAEPAAAAPLFPEPAPLEAAEQPALDLGSGASSEAADFFGGGDAAAPVQAEAVPPQQAATLEAAPHEIFQDVAGPAAAAPVAEAEPVPDMSPAEQAYQRGLEAFQDSQMDDALAACEQAVALDEMMPKAHLLMGRILIRAQDFLRAVTSLRRGEELAPDNPEIFFFLGQAYEKRGLNDEARAAYQKCLDVAPEGPQADRVREWLHQAEEAGRASTGVRCEYCLRTFPVEEMTVHDGKNCCQECLNTLGVSAPAAADTALTDSAVSEVALAEFEEEQEKPKKGIIRRFVRFVFVLAFLAVIAAVVCFVGHHMKWFTLPDEVMKHEYVLQAEKLVHQHTGWPPKPEEKPEPKPKPEILEKLLAITSTPPAEVKLLARWEYKPEFENIPNDVVPVVTVESGPEGMAIDEESGAVVWTPGAVGAIEVPSTHEFTVKAKVGEKELTQKVKLELAFGLAASEPKDIGTDPSFFVCVAAGDLNDDKLDDVAVAAGRYRRGELRIFFQQQEGGFSDALVFELTGQPRDIAVADVDGDGRKDVLLVDWMNSVLAVFKPSDAGVLEKPESDVKLGKGPLSMVVADLVGDEKPEVAAVCSGADSVSVLTDGGAKVAAKMPLGLPPGWGKLLSGAFTGEETQLLLILAGGAEGDQIKLYGQKEGGRFTEISGARPFKSVPVSATVLARGDSPDLLATLHGGKEAKVLLVGWNAEGAASKVGEMACAPDPRVLLAADINGDGLGDIAVGHPDGVRLYLGRAEGFLPLPSVKIEDGCVRLAVADADGDGRRDIIVVTGSGKIIPVIVEP